MAAAKDIGVRALLVARVVTLPAGVFLGLESDDIAGIVVLVNTLVALLWIGTTTIRVRRRGLTRRTGLVILAGDTAIALTGIIATGGASSEMCRLLGVLPLAIAFAYGPEYVAIVTAAGLLGLIFLAGGDTDPLLPVLAVLAWAGVAGAALAEARIRRVRKIAEQLGLRERLARAHGGADARERLRAAEEIHVGALVEVRRLAADTRAAGTPGAGLVEEPASLAARCRETGLQIRGLVSELHAMSARPIVLRTALAQLVARRADASGREITASVAQSAQGHHDDLVLVLVRDLLDAIPPEHPATSIAVEVRASLAEAVEVRVTVVAGPGDPPAFGDDDMAVALVRERVGWVSDATFALTPDRAVATLPLTVAAPARPDRVEEPALIVAVPGVAGLLAIGAIAAAADVHSVSFWLAYALAAVGGLAVSAAAVTERILLGTRGLTAIAIADGAMLLVLLTLAGPGRQDLLLLIVGLVPVFAFAFRPRQVAVLAGAVGLGAAAIAGFSACFLVAFLWSLTIALLLADASSAAVRIEAAVLHRRAAALQRLMEAEEDARRAMARRLHDDALQLLFVAGQELEEAAALPPGDDGRTAAIARATDALTQAEAVVAGTSGAGAHEELPDGGLVPALHALAAAVARRGRLAVDVQLPEALPPGPHDSLLYGVARELLTNVVRHADAGAVALTVEAAPGSHTVLRVTDDGRGVTARRVAEAAAAGHVGLAAARDRLARAGGHLTLERRSSGGGTAATVVLPSPAGGT